MLLENLVISMGRQWMILAFTVGKMLVAIGAVAHILACIWFAVGDTVQSAGQHRSWLEFAGITREQGATFEIQYIHSLIWMLLPPSPPPLDPFSGIEHLAAGSSDTQLHGKVAANYCRCFSESRATGAKSWRTLEAWGFRLKAHLAISSKASRTGKYIGIAKLPCKTRRTPSSPALLCFDVLSQKSRLVPERTWGLREKSYIRPLGWNRLEVLLHRQARRGPKKSSRVIWRLWDGWFPSRLRADLAHPRAGRAKSHAKSAPPMAPIPPASTRFNTWEKLRPKHRVQFQFPFAPLCARSLVPRI